MQTPSEPSAIGTERWAAPGQRRSIFGNFRAPEAVNETPAPEALAGLEAHPGCSETLQSLIDVAMGRAFVYRFLARAFEYPDAEGWAWLADSPTQNALCVAVEAIEPARATLKCHGEELASSLRPDSFDRFVQDYVTAFGHAARGSCPLNEIEYGDLKADPLFQPHRLADLAAFYRAFGLEVSEHATERHDHICIELEFMSVLAAKEAFAWEQQAEEEQLSQCLQTQKKFLREHLGRWTPAFARRLASALGQGPLETLAKFTHEFVTADCYRFGVTPASEDLLLRPVDESSESLCASCGIRSLPPGALAVNGADWIAKENEAP